MKYFFTFSFFIIFFTFSFSQSRVEKYNTYLDQYEYFDKNGKMVATKKYNKYLKQWEYYEIKVDESNEDDIPPIKVDYLGEVLAIKQARYDREVEELRRQQQNVAQINKQKAVVRMNQIIDYYNSSKSQPITVKDGWHSVYAMNNYDFCDQRKVYVENNKITEYIIDDWIARTVSYSTPTQYGKATIRLAESKDDLINVFFLDYMADANSYSTPPLKSGRVSFWTDSRIDYTDVFVEGNYIGTISKRFKKETPSCGETGTVIFEGKPGKYDYIAESSIGRWSGVITVSSSKCTTLKLTK